MPSDHAGPTEGEREREARPGPLRIEILTIFPDLVESWLRAGVVGRAWSAGVIDLRVHDLRSGADDARRSVDDAPFGGGPGMVLAPAPIFRVVEAVRPRRPLLLLSPAGRRFDQSVAAELAAGGGVSLLCGRYEGVDARVAEHLVDGELSLGDFVLAGGEVAALAVVEAVARLVPGVLGNEGSALDESFGADLLEYPQYTRPAVFRGLAVPAVLLSGDHAKVAEWRRAAALARTAERRPDLIRRRGGISEAECQLLRRYGYHCDLAVWNEPGSRDEPHRSD